MNPNLNEEQYIKLVDFSIFMMKLIKRLETQSHNYILEYPDLNVKT
jgi:hypothetical protein